MILCLDIGNTQLFGGVYDGDKLCLRFRKETQTHNSADELGVFLRNVLRENGIEYQSIKKIAICSVVPTIDYSLRNACIRYFSITPVFLQPKVKTGIKIKTKIPTQVGADLISVSIAANKLFPNDNLVVVDLGTATTFCAVSNKNEYLAAVFLPGIRVSMETLFAKASKLPAVEIVQPTTSAGRNTNESIQSGLYYGHLGAMREIISRLSKELFPHKPPKVVATGGFAQLFKDQKVFDVIVPDLVLEGLKIMLELNGETKQAEAYSPELA